MLGKAIGRHHMRDRLRPQRHGGAMGGDDPVVDPRGQTFEDAGTAGRLCNATACCIAGWFLDLHPNH